MGEPTQTCLGALARFAVIGLLGLGCGACSEEYYARRDTLSAGSGDAVRRDIATHEINPWPLNAMNDLGPTDGQRLQHAMESYRNPSSGAGALTQPTVAAGAVPSTR